MIEILVASLIFGSIILIHEFGHYLAARFIGVRVITFSFGFGPRLFQRRIGETLFCISALPLGGYVRPFYVREDVPETKESKLLRWIAPLSKDEKESLSLFIKEKKGNLSGASFLGTLFFLLNGLILNILVAYLIYSVAFLNYAQVKAYVLEPRVGKVDAASAATEADIRRNDLFLSIDGAKVASWKEAGEILRSGKDKKFSIEIQRLENSAPITKLLSFTPTADRSSPSRLAYGFQSATELRTPTLIEGFKFAASGMADTAIAFSKQIFLGEKTPDSDEEPASSWGLIGNLLGVGIFASESFKNFLSMFVGMSIIIVILNAVPYPAFDGGQILLLVIEKIRGAELSFVFKQKLAFFGLASSLLLMVAALGSDLYHSLSLFFTSQ